jgi:hypothetical protein
MDERVLAHAKLIAAEVERLCRYTERLNLDPVEQSVTLYPLREMRRWSKTLVKEVETSNKQKISGD